MATQTTTQQKKTSQSTGSETSTQQNNKSQLIFLPTDGGKATNLPMCASNWVFLSTRSHSHFIHLQSGWSDTFIIVKLPQNNEKFNKSHFIFVPALHSNKSPDPTAISSIDRWDTLTNSSSSSLHRTSRNLTNHQSFLCLHFTANKSPHEFTGGRRQAAKVNEHIDSFHIHTTILTMQTI